MLSKRSLSKWTLSERQVLQWYWLRNGRCTRCFHESQQRRAEETPKGGNDGNDQGTPFNAPKRGPTRQQRSAMVSKEVQMLQRDRPSPSFGEPDPNTLRPPGASQTVDPEAVGLNVGRGSMGENDVATQEGPFAQGVAVNVRSDVDAGADTRAARGTGQPFTVEGAAERGGSGLESGLGASTGERLGRPPPEEDEDEDDEDEREGEEEDNDVPDAWTKQQQRVAGTDHPVQPDLFSRDELLHDRSGSTIAASNFEGIIEDRLRAVAEPGLDANGTRNITNLARKLMNGKPVRFESKEEKAAVLQMAKDIAKRQAGAMARRKTKKNPDEVQPAARVYNFAPMPETVQEALVNDMVKGTYDDSGLLEGTEKYRQTVLNGVARATMMNGTYLARDGERLLEKVRSLLPAATTTTQQKVRQQKGGN